MARRRRLLTKSGGVFRADIAAVAHFVMSGRRGAICAAIEFSVGFQSVPDDFASAVKTLGCHCMNRALKTVKNSRVISHRDRESLVIFVAAD